MSHSIYVTGKVCIKKDKLKEAKELMRSLIAKTLQNEKGCILYTYLQNTRYENEFTSFEIWKDDIAEAKHLEMEYVREAFEILPDLLDSPPEITKWSEI